MTSKLFIPLIAVSLTSSAALSPNEARQLREEATRFNAEAALLAVDDLAKNPSYDAATHRAAVKTLAARRDWAVARLADANDPAAEEAAALVRNYPLHEERWEDDWFTLNFTGRALPNRWGLYDMHGNAAEWTSTTTNGLAVARGGSFASRPKDATSSFKTYYFPWQKVYDVGFRVRLEE